MALKRIKYCPAQHPILPWWEDVSGKEVKDGLEHFLAQYHNREGVVLQFRHLPLTFLDGQTLEAVTIEREADNNIWVEVENEVSTDK